MVMLESWTPAPKAPGQRLAFRCCLNCSEQYQPIRVDQLFDKPECKREYHNREMLRSKAVYRALYRWRKARGKDSKDQFTILCRTVDRWVQEDRAAGRAPPPHDDGDETK